MSKETISTTTTVIQSVAKKLNVDVAKVESVYDGLVKYLYHLMNFTNATTIKIPHVGRLVALARDVNSRLVYLQNRKYRSTFDELKLEAFSKKKEAIDNHLKELGEISFVTYSHHMRRHKIKSKYFTSGLTLQEIEEKQNEEEK